MCSVSGMLLEQHPSHRTHILRRRIPDLQPTTTLDNTPYCCNHSLTLLKMGKRLPEICWALSNINKIVIFASIWSSILFTYIERWNTNQIYHAASCYVFRDPTSRMSVQLLLCLWWNLVFCRTERMAADFDLIAENHMSDVFSKCSLVIWPICVVILYNLQLDFNHRPSEELDASETLFQHASIFSLESSRTSSILLALGLRHTLPTHAYMSLRLIYGCLILVCLKRHAY